jgi:hypothetical protein
MIETANDDFRIPRLVPTLIAQSIASSLSGFWFVPVGVKIAPAAKTNVALSLAVLCGTTAVAVPAYYALRGALFLSVGDIIAMLLTAVAAAYMPISKPNVIRFRELETSART